MTRDVRLRTRLQAFRTSADETLRVAVDKDVDSQILTRRSKVVYCE